MEKGYGICFETQYFPDAIHKENFESPITKAGEVYDTTTYTNSANFIKI